MATHLTLYYADRPIPAGESVHACMRCAKVASFPGSPEREINTREEPGIFSRDHDVIK